MEFRTQYKRTPSKKEKGGGIALVERAGYVSNKIRIENMLLAGQRLQDYRREKYDFVDGEEIDESFYDPTRSKSFDLADGTQLGMEAMQNLKAQEQKQKAAIKAAEEDQKASDEAEKVKVEE